MVNMKRQPEKKSCDNGWWYLHNNGELVGPRSLLQQKVLVVQRIQEGHKASCDPSQLHPLKGIVQLVLREHVA